MNRTAFEPFVEQEYDRVVRTAYWMTGDRQDSLDLAQECFVRAYQRWTSVSTMDRPDAWLQRVVVNLALSERRRRRALGRLHAPSEEATSAEVDAPDPALRRALLELTPAQRSVIVLRFYLDRSVDDVARDLGKRPGTVRALTSQGLSKLRAVLLTGGRKDEARR